MYESVCSTGSERLISGLFSGGVCGYPRANWYIWLVMLLLRDVGRGVDCGIGRAFEQGDDDVDTVKRLYEYIILLNCC